MSGSRQIESVSIRVLTDTGEVENVRQIERDSAGRMFVRTTLGKVIAAARIIEIIPNR